MNYLKRLNPKLLLGLALVGTIAMACDSEETVSPDEPAQITTVIASFANDQTDDVVTGSFRDLDGPGGESPSISGVTLDADARYTVTLQFLDERETPADDITDEIREEDLEHQVFFVIGGNIGIRYAYDDVDRQGNPLGLRGKLTTTASTGNASIQVILIDQPNKSLNGVAEGDLNNAGGVENIRIQLPISVQ